MINLTSSFEWCYFLFCAESVHVQLESDKNMFKMQPRFSLLIDSFRADSCYSTFYAMKLFII